MKCFRKISALIIAGVMGITYTCYSVPVYAWSREENKPKETANSEVIQKTKNLMETVTPGAVEEVTATPASTESPLDVIPTKGASTQIPSTNTPEITSPPIQTNIPDHTSSPIKTLLPPTLLPKDTAIPSATERPGGTNVQEPVATVKPPSDGEGYCQITYQLNGGKNHKNNPIKVKKKGVSVVLNAPSKAKYTFAGWYTDAKYTNKITAVGNTSLSFLTLYAKWKKVTVKQAVFSYAKKNGASSILVKVKKESGVAGFEYVYAKDWYFKRKYRLHTEKNPKTLSKLTKKKTYYIKVRAYKLDSTGKKVYGIYSRIKKVKLKN
ncbi:MAG: InlB B-repeat-containing protein [Lachnospiraceae bacterium]|nr:InlB B-repeat-containing protein [Lachnospiraceae bacterium]